MSSGAESTWSMKSEAPNSRSNGVPASIIEIKLHCVEAPLPRFPIDHTSSSPTGGPPQLPLDQVKPAGMKTVVSAFVASWGPLFEAVKVTVTDEPGVEPAGGLTDAASATSVTEVAPRSATRTALVSMVTVPGTVVSSWAKKRLSAPRDRARGTRTVSI